MVKTILPPPLCPPKDHGHATCSEASYVVQQHNGPAFAWTAHWSLAYSLCFFVEPSRSEKITRYQVDAGWAPTQKHQFILPTLLSKNLY